MRPINRFSIFSIFVSLSAPLSAQTWNGGASINWSDAANWDPGIPASGDNIIISTATTRDITLDDASHTVGSISFGDTGTRATGLSIFTTPANTLTINGGVTANGAFTMSNGLRLRGNIVVSGTQTWQVGGEAGSLSADRGVVVNETPTPATTGTFVLNGTINKTGPGQLSAAATTLSGPGDININEGSLKFNAGGSRLLTVDGPGKIAVNGSSTLILSKNTGTFSITRDLHFNGTSSLLTGSGATSGQGGPWAIASNIEWNGDHVITANPNTAGTPTAVNFNFTGVMSGAGTLIKRGPSQTILGGTSPNTFSGPVTVEAGELRLDKTGGGAVNGNILVTGGSLRINQSDQIADTASVTINGGNHAFVGDRAETIASFSNNSTATSSISGLTVTGATTTTAGLLELNSGQTFTTHSLSISNNAMVRPVGNGAFNSVINVGAGGINLNTSRMVFGNNGNATSITLNLGGDVVASGTNVFSVTNYSGPRRIDLQGGARSFVVNDGTLDIRYTIHNGSFIKSGPGRLILSRVGSDADFSFTQGPVKITGAVNAANATMSAGALEVDLANTASKITTSGNFVSTGGTIEVAAAGAGAITQGLKELVRYNGTLTGQPPVNLDQALVTSRTNPTISYGTGSNSSISVTLANAPKSLFWVGNLSGGLWDLNNTANFNGNTETFYSLDSVTFDDTGSSTVTLNSNVFPKDVVFEHGFDPGDDIPFVSTLTVSGSGGISGSTNVTKRLPGTTILATANSYTGKTEVAAGTLSLKHATLSDTAPVVIAATGAVLNLDFTGTDQVGSLQIGTAVLANGVYDAVTHPNIITGTGSLRVGPATGGNGFAAWAAGFPFQAGVNDGALNDPDGDGISNLLEYVLGGVPIGAGASNTSILPTKTLTATDLVLTFQRSDVSEADTALKVQWSSDLVTWNDFATIGATSSLPAVAVTEDSPTAAFDTVVVSIPRSTSPTGKLFARVVAAK